MSLVRPLFSTVTTRKMAVALTIIVVNLHVIHHSKTNELWHIYVSNNYLFENNMFIRKVKDHQYLRKF